jgi:O-antigen/teichoic acid export membrane protein
LYALAFLILLVPLIGVYHTLLQARGLAKVSAKIIIWSLGLNIVLTYLFAKLFLSTGEITIILAVAAAVTISQLFLLIASIVYASKRLGIYFSKQTLYSVIKPIIASIVMALLVRMYLNYFNGRFHSLIAVVVGIVSYFIILFLIKGLGREDWNNLKLLTKVK